MRNTILLFVVVLLISSGCATTAMKTGNKAENAYAKRGLAALKSGNTEKACFYFQAIEAISNAELATYGSVPEEILDEKVSVYCYMIYNDQMFKIGQIVSGAVGGYFGLTGTQATVGGISLLTLLSVAAGFAKKWWDERKEKKTIETQKVEIEKLARANISALEEIERHDPALAKDAKDAIRRSMLNGTMVDNIVQEESEKHAAVSPPKNNS